MNRDEALLKIWGHCDRPTATRLKKLLKAVYGVKMENSEIESKVAVYSVAVERTGEEKSYPDVWSVFLETVTRFKMLREIWGENIADLWAATLAPNESIWFNRCRLLGSTAVRECRRHIYLDPEDCTPLRFSTELTYKVMIMAINRQRERDQAMYEGIEFPLNDHVDR
jgi:hypothetical protein